MEQENHYTRLILGLLRQQRKHYYFGNPSRKSRHSYSSLILGSAHRIAVAVVHFDGGGNLTIFQKSIRVPTKRIGEVLDLVGLIGTGKKKMAVFAWHETGAWVIITLQ